MCAEVLLYLFHSLKWHSAVFKESLCSFQDFLLPFQRQCLKQYKVIARASEVRRSAFWCYLSTSLSPTAEQLAAWGMRHNSDRHKFFTRLNNHNKSGEQFSLQYVEFLRWISVSFWIKKNISMIFFFPLKWNILLWEKKYHHWNPFQIPAN